MKILTAPQMQSIDRRATERFAVPSLVLMENAALEVGGVKKMRFEVRSANEEVRRASSFFIRASYLEPLSS